MDYFYHATNMFHMEHNYETIALKRNKSILLVTYLAQLARMGYGGAA